MSRPADDIAGRADWLYRACHVGRHIGGSVVTLRNRSLPMRGALTAWVIDAKSETAELSIQ